MKNERKPENDCEKATFLIEKKQLDGISSTDDVFLEFHLNGCPECRIYEQQSEVIGAVCKEIFCKEEPFSLRLNDTDKQQMEQLIKKELGEL